MEKQNLYERPVTLKNILKFAVPTIAMTVFMSFYTMVDGLFVSNLIGTNALSAFSRSFVFMLITMIILPLILGVNGIWLATPAAELMALALSAVMFFKYRKRYGY